MDQGAHFSFTDTSWGFSCFFDYLFPPHPVILLHVGGISAKINVFHKSFFWKCFIDPQHRLSDDLQLLVINASSDLWPLVLHQNSSERPSTDRSMRQHIDLDACSAGLFLPYCLCMFTSFHLQANFYISIPDLGLSGLSHCSFFADEQMNCVLSHYNEATDSL